jgi:hypothetical protein
MYNATCCTPTEAWAWVEVLAEEALDGNQVSIRLLPFAVEHWARMRLA